MGGSGQSKRKSYTLDMSPWFVMLDLDIKATLSSQHTAGLHRTLQIFRKSRRTETLGEILSHLLLPGLIPRLS